MSPEQIAAGAAVVVSFAAMLVARFRGRFAPAGSMAEIEKLRGELDAAISRARAAERKATPDLLSQYARAAVDYAEQMGGDAVAKKRHAVEFVQLRDAQDNGKRDWPDALIGTAIEAELGSRR